MNATKTLIVGALMLGLGWIAFYRHNDRGRTMASVVKLTDVSPAAKIDDGGEKALSGSGGSESPAPKYKTGLVMVLQDRHNFSLSAAEARAIEKAYSFLVRERESLELSLAEGEKVDENTVVITIPEHFSKGMELYSDFVETLRKDLGGDRSFAVLNATETWIRASNSGFGAVAQEISIEQRGATYHIVHNRGTLLEFNRKPLLSNISTVSDGSANSLGYYQFLSRFLPNPKS